MPDIISDPRTTAEHRLTGHPIPTRDVGDLSPVQDLQHRPIPLLHHTQLHQHPELLPRSWNNRRSSTKKDQQQLGVTHLPELVSPRNRNRVRNVSPRNRNRCVKHLPDSHTEQCQQVTTEVTMDNAAALLRRAKPQVNWGGAEGTRTPSPHTASRDEPSALVRSGPESDFLSGIPDPRPSPERPGPARSGGVRDQSGFQGHRGQARPPPSAGRARASSGAQPCRRLRRWVGRQVERRVARLPGPLAHGHRVSRGRPRAVPAPSRWALSNSGSALGSMLSTTTQSRPCALARH